MRRSRFLRKLAGDGRVVAAEDSLARVLRTHAISARAVFTGHFELFDPCADRDTLRPRGTHPAGPGVWPGAVELRGLICPLNPTVGTKAELASQLDRGSMPVCAGRNVCSGGPALHLGLLMEGLYL